MKRILFLPLLLLPLWLFAQGFGSFSHDQPFFAKDVTRGAADDFPLNWTVGYRWVASDVDTNNAPVSTWTDRIHGVNFLASTNKPIGTPNGVTFYRTNWMWLQTPLNFNAGEDNQGDANSNKWSYLVVASGDVLPGGGAFFLLSAANATTASFLFVNSDSTWRVGNNNLLSYVANKNMEIYVKNQSLPAYAPSVWTNGAYRTANAAVSNSWSLIGAYFGMIGTLNHIGTIKEIVIWTNATLQSTNYVGKVHQYVTNHYNNF